VRKGVAAPMSEKTYRVLVTREDDAWLADVKGLSGAHTYARSLAGLDRSVREVIVLMADLPDEDLDSVDVAYEYRTGSTEVDKEAGRLRRLRADLDRQSRDVNARTAKLARELVAAGWSVRDVGALLGISPQRVSQLANVRATPRRGRSTKASQEPKTSRQRATAVSKVARSRSTAAKRTAAQRSSA
ncbi:MAG: hypothetical protein ACRDYU_06840, partial [Actinomycetes bacterium]